MNEITKIREAGVIGAGGAGFPTYAKLQAKADYILMNAAECEPLLRVDQQLAVEEVADVIEGFAKAREVVQAPVGIIGIKRKHSAAIAALEGEILKRKLQDVIRIQDIPDVYPAGDEQVLVYELTGRVVPEAGIPIHVGCVVINVETSMNIARALRDIPVTEKYVTVTGDVDKPITVKVPVGTPILDVLAAAGVRNLEQYSVIDGGPMMGNVLPDCTGAITKKNKGFVVLKKEHYLIRKKTAPFEKVKKINKSACAQCHICTDMCPRFLLGHNMQPHKMMRALSYEAASNLESKTLAQLCSQCNLCELFSCPMGMYPRRSNLYFKTKLAEEKIKYQPLSNTFQPRSARKARQVSTKRLVQHLNLKPFDRPAPLTDVAWNTEKYYFYFSQHVGAKAEAVVAVGTPVRKGQVIARSSESVLGTVLHASVDGVVEEINEKYMVIRRNETCPMQ